MSQELVDSVNKLTGETTKLLLEYTDSNTTLKNSAASAKEDASKAAMSESAAATSNAEAKNAELAAKAEADRAELAATQATQVTGLETVEQAVTQALADGGYTWRTEADMQHERAVNNEMFAASGFVRFGHHDTNQVTRPKINEGMWSCPEVGRENVLVTGHEVGAGASKSKAPVVNLAGFITDFDDVNLGGWVSQRTLIKFPEAEAGTRVYDSATGISIDYAKEVDPKYGDIAPDHNEAVARAFEGVIKNGDFRNGLSGWIDNINTVFTVQDGYLSIYGNDEGAGSASGHAEVYIADLKVGDKIEVSYFAKNTLGDCAVYWWGQSADPNSVSNPSNPTNEWQKFTFTFTLQDLSTTTHKRIYVGGPASRPSGSKVMDIANVSIRKVTQEVVTDRVDMFGFEGFLEQITPTNPFVYKHGLIQSQSTDIDGIATTASNRPDTYYAVYDGDTTSKGKGVNFLALSVIEQDLIASNPKNHIYRMANGDIVQWRIRQRTIAGPGNGSWSNVIAAKVNEEAPLLRFIEDLPWHSLGMRPQGAQNAPRAEGATLSYDIYTSRDEGTYNWHSVQGAFTATNSWKKDNRFGYEGMCYFLVCGTVSRLNQGAYHPSLNPTGSNRTPSSTINSRREWFNADSALNTKSTITKSDLFIGTCQEARRRGFTVASDFADSAAWLYGGKISQALTGRSDQYEYYDAIYAGQVNDMRMSAWGVSDYSKSLTDAISRDIGGATRGKGRVPFTAIIPVDDAELIRFGSAQLIRTSANANDEDLTRNPHLTRALERYVGEEGLGNLSPTLANELSASDAVLALNGKGKSYLCFDVAGESNTRVYQMTGSTIGSDVCGLVGVGATPELEFTVTPVSGSAFIMWCLGDHMGSQYAPITELVNHKASAYYDIIPHIDVVGHPRAIAEKFPDGVSGQWIAFDYDNGANYNQLELNRKKTSTSLLSVYHDGASWLKRPISFDNVLNKPTWGGPISSVELWYYETPADFTEKSDNLAVVGGLSDVATLNHCKAEKGNRLHFSLISEVGKGQFNSSSFEFLPMVSYQIGSTSPDKLETATTIPHSHAPMSGLLSAVNAPGAIKTLAHLVEKNGQLFVQHHATQLLHSGENWGDDSQVTVVNNESTKTDDNGNVVKVVTHTGINPIGWVKNEI